MIGKRCGVFVVFVLARLSFGLNTDWFDQRVDHFDPSNSETFRQKFILDLDFWRNESSPVVLYISGEAPLNPKVFESRDFSLRLAQEIGGALVSIEHRFYGDSIPRSEQGLSTENLKFLSTRQALADLAGFISWFDESYRKGAKGPWISVGGSYAGALSAWFRITYPDVVDIAVSSSGVVNSILDFYQYDQRVGLAVQDQPYCLETLHAVTSAFEEALVSGERDVRKEFGASLNISDADFMYIIADSAAGAVQYSNKTFLCDALVSAFLHKRDLIDAFREFTEKKWGKDFASGCSYDTECLRTDRKSADRAWRWQTCTELAYFQTAPAEGSIRSSRLTLEYHLAQCEAIFETKLVPAVDATNAYYGGAFPNSSFIIFIDSSDDPWQEASIKQSLSSTEPLVYIDCVDCGHCIDLHNPAESDPPALRDARKTIMKTIKQWLAKAEQ
jgi:hypothetical protein